MFFKISISLIFLTSADIIARSRGQHDPHYVDGRTTMVHLFEWRWKDIGEECVRFLGPMGYAGVQVSPVTENIVAWQPPYNSEVRRPWFERYQTVSFSLDSTRSGNDSEFQNMVKTCNKVGVRIYVDVIINHMTGFWPIGTKGTGGSLFDFNRRSYPAVPFEPNEFNGKNDCSTASGSIEEWQDPVQLRNCMLMGLADINQRLESVRGKIVAYLNKLIDYGVAGLRIDAAKHMWPEDLKEIYNRLHDLPTNHSFLKGSRPFIFQEALVLGEDIFNLDDYTNIGVVTEFKYGYLLGTVFKKHENKNLSLCKNLGEAWGMLESRYAFVFLDNHDKQRDGDPNILTFRDGRLYRMATAFMLAWPYGIARVMSSFYWPQRIVGGHDENNWIGPPHDINYETLPVTINEDNSCGNGWICEHRWPQTVAMAKFRNVVAGTEVANWWDNGANQVAFSRGNKGFIAFNNDLVQMAGSFQTGLPEGEYCDVISGNIVNGQCTGIIISVNYKGVASISIPDPDHAPDGVIAIHIQARQDGNSSANFSTPGVFLTAALALYLLEIYVWLCQ